MRPLTKEERDRATTLISNAFWEPDIVQGVRLMLASIQATRDAFQRQREKEMNDAMKRCEELAAAGDPVALWLMKPIPAKKGDVQTWLEDLPEELRDTE